MIKFQDSTHLYTSIVPDDKKWSSVTGVLSTYKEKFQTMDRSESCSINPNSPWFGIPPEEIRAIWKAESERSTILGSWYHQVRENELCCKNMSPVIDGWKHALPQQIEEGVYPEMIIYHPEYNLCGQSDKIECVEDIIHISDYKTSKKIDRRSFRGKRMLGVLSHLEDCELNSYTLQLSLYMKMLLHHNPDKKPGKLTIEHVKFKVKEYDKHNYPVHERTPDGGYIVESIEYIQCKYLEKEAGLIMQNL